MKILTSIVFILYMSITYSTAQALPKKKLMQHLYLSGENPESDYNNNNYGSMLINKDIGNDSIAIYGFSSNSPTAYEYLLLKVNIHYQILNGYNFYEEWPKIDSVLKLIDSSKITYKDIEIIVGTYIYNNGYHGTPPLIRRGKNGGLETYYPPNKRKTIETKPFIFISK